MVGSVLTGVTKSGKTKIDRRKVMLEKMFKLKEHKTTPKIEIIAGITTFMTMGYILIVNPDILSVTGMDKGAVFTATALSAFIATMVMALYANKPFTLASGMGLNAFFAFTVVLQMGYTWQFALTAVFLEGIIFIIMTFFKIRVAIINSIPYNLKKAVSVGIGLFIAFIGLQGGGVIVHNPATLVSIGSITSSIALLTLIGLVITGIMLAKKVKGALLIGIVVTTVIAVSIGLVNEVVPHDQLDARVSEMAAHIARAPSANLSVLKDVSNTWFENMGMESS